MILKDIALYNRSNLNRLNIETYLDYIVQFVKMLITRKFDCALLWTTEKKPHYEYHNNQTR